MLGDEGLQHQHLGQRFGGALFGPGRGERGGVVHMRREVGAVPQVPAAAHHGQVHASAAAVHPHGQDVDIAVAGREAAGIHRLLVQHPRQGADLVAHLGRLLEGQHLGVRQHTLLQAFHHLLRVTEQKGFGILHVAGVIRRTHQAHTRPGAAAYLVQQTGP
jgi:hypothetical protein